MAHGRRKSSLLVGFVLFIAYLRFLESCPKVFRRGRTEIQGKANESLEDKIMLKQRNDSKGSQDKTPVVLLFHSAPHRNIWPNHLKSVGNSLMKLRRCHHKCFYTLNRQLYEESANLVVVATYYFRLFNDSLTPERIKARQDRSGQIWLAINHEAPLIQISAGGPSGGSLDGIFNWVGHYRADADINMAYGRVVKRNSNHSTVTQVPQKKNKKLASWLVSNCETNSRREVLVRNLQRFIPIDVYGKCQKLKCPMKKRWRCRAFLSQHYKFYMAFENSLCMDYVTEKAFNALTNNLVPVIYNWLNDSTLLPPGSYINALDFNTPKDLADYLRYLDTHEDEYLKFFEWKRNFELSETGDYDLPLCEACAKLRRHLEMNGGRLKRYSSMLRWMNSSHTTDNPNGLQFKFGPNVIHTKDFVCVDASKSGQVLDWLSH